MFSFCDYSRSDSTIVTPYEKFVFRPVTEVDEDAPNINYGKRKSKMVSWFVSNCVSNNNVRKKRKIKSLMFNDHVTVYLKKKHPLLIMFFYNKLTWRKIFI